MSRSGMEDISGLVGEELPYLGDVVDVTGSPAGNQKLYRQGAGGHPETGPEIKFKV